MAHLPVQCQNCGARYKIPETFKSDKAKCKACGSMIDVAAARDASDTDAEPKPAGTRASGGTRKPRETATAGSSRRESDGDGGKTKAPTRLRSARRLSGRDADDEGEEGEEGGRHRYEKKKDNTPMIAGIVIVALAAVAGIFWMVYDPDQGNNKEIASNSSADSNKGEAEKAGDGKPEVNAAEADAKKDADAKAKAEAAAAKKKKADAAKKLRPKTKRAQAIKADEDVKDPEDVFKPASALKVLPRPEGMTDERFKEINDALDGMLAGGLTGIRARNKLPAMGVGMIPLATNKLLAMDFTTFQANEYAYGLGKIIGGITEFGLGWEPVQAGEDVDPKVGNRNAGRVWDLHVMARLHWNSTEKFETWQAKRPKK